MKLGKFIHYFTDNGWSFTSPNDSGNYYGVFTDPDGDDRLYSFKDGDGQLYLVDEDYTDDHDINDFDYENPQNYLDGYDFKYLFEIQYVNVEYEHIEVSTSGNGSWNYYWGDSVNSDDDSNDEENYDYEDSDSDDDDEESDDDTEIWFQPWVGDDYWDNGGVLGRKILVIGNNHYCGNRESCDCCGVDGDCFSDDDGCAEFTQDVVSNYLDYQDGDGEFEGWMNTYSNFEQALDSDDSSRDIWNSLAFYNYLQTAVANDDNKTNSNGIYNEYYDSYCSSEDCLWKVISDLDPDYIIVWGSIVRNHIGNEIEDKTGIPTLCIKHPSIGFSKSYWQQELSDFLEFENDDSDDGDDSDSDDYESSDDEDDNDSNNDYSSGEGGCFITTAVCKTFGKPDDCYELTAFRNFRDTFMQQSEVMKKDVLEYYRIAPAICSKISESKEQANSIYTDIWNNSLSKALKEIEMGNNENAYKIYKDMVLDLKKKNL